MAFKDLTRIKNLLKIYDELNICLTIHNEDQQLIPNSESEDNLRNIRYNNFFAYY